MSHFKCVTCKTRLSIAGSAGPIDDRCPGCGAAFEPAAELAELVGYRAVTSRDRSGEGGTPGPDQSFVDRLGDLLDRRALQAQARLDAERWIDGGPRAAADAIELPRPGTNR